MEVVVIEAQNAARELFDAVQENYYGFDELKYI